MLSDLTVLSRMLRGQPRAERLQDRLEGFYRPQARDYDRFREKLLHGRQELLTSLVVPTGGTVVEMGCGTGRNLEYFGPRLATFAEVTIVDLCPSLLAEARARCARQGWENVRCVEADAALFKPPKLVDCVYLSYSLSMIPDWFLAVDNALAMLKPGGLLGVVDFYVARRDPPPQCQPQGGLTRHFWPWWFAHDGVFPSPDHLPYLLTRTLPVALSECRGSVPYLPGITAPYYRFIGRKPVTGPGVRKSGSPEVS